MNMTRSMISKRYTHYFLHLCLSVFICNSLTVTANAAKLGPLEQMRVEDYAKLREVERYQLKIAQQYYMKEDWKVAAGEYEKFLQLYERSVGAPYAQLMWSNCQVKQRKVNTAIKEGYQSVIDYWPQSPEATVAAFAIGRAYKASGEVRKAKKAYATVIEEHPKHIVAILAKLDLLAYAKVEDDQDRRIALLKNLTFDTPRTKENGSYCSNAARELASIHFYGNAFDEGVKALETTYKDGSLTYYIYVYTRSPVSHMTGRESQKQAGLKLADRVIKLLEAEVPTDISEDKAKASAREWLYRVASMHSYARRQADVLKTYERMVKLFGADDDLRGNIASWYISHKRRDRARQLYEQFDDKIKGLSLIAGMLREDGKWDEAIQVYTDLISQDADNTSKWTWQIAECYESSNRLKEAINTYRQTDNFPSNYNAMAKCHRRLKQWNEALVLYNQVMSVPSAAPAAALEIGRTYEQAGKKESAIRSFQRVCKQFPKTGQASTAHAHLQRKYNITVTLGGAKDD